MRDLGLIAPGASARVVNPIYRKVIVRILGGIAEDSVTACPSSFRLPDGRIDMDELLRSFAEFWRENGEILASGPTSPEVAAQLAMMAYLHRTVNGAGFIDREYGGGPPTDRPADPPGPTPSPTDRGQCSARHWS